MNFSGVLRIKNKDNTMKIIVCGGRDYSDKEFLFKILDFFHINKGITLIVQGGAKGADALAIEWANKNLVEYNTYLADWTAFGKFAGPLRNKKMAKDGADLCIAFPGGTGTKNMIEAATYFNIPVLDLEKMLDVLLDDL